MAREQSILTLPEITTFSNADYVMIDSLDNGSNKFKAKSIGISKYVAPTQELLYEWNFKRSMRDIVSNKTAVATGATRTSSGLVFGAVGDRVVIDGFSNIGLMGKAVEIDVDSFSFHGDATKEINFVLIPNVLNTFVGPLRFEPSVGWCVSANKTINIRSNTKTSPAWSQDMSGDSYATINYFDGKTIRFEFRMTKSGQTYNQKTKLFVDGQLIDELENYFVQVSDSSADKLVIGSRNVNNPSVNSGDQCYDMVISGLRVYNLLQGENI